VWFFAEVWQEACAQAHAHLPASFNAMHSLLLLLLLLLLVCSVLVSFAGLSHAAGLTFGTILAQSQQFEKAFLCVGLLLACVDGPTLPHSMQRMLAAPTAAAAARAGCACCGDAAVLWVLLSLLLFTYRTVVGQRQVSNVFASGVCKAGAECSSKQWEAMSSVLRFLGFARLFGFY
jgi:hypothetical protein